MPKPTILIVDDEKNIRRSVQMICTAEGYLTKTAEDAEEAYKLLEAGHIDLTLLDIGMPGMDGLQFLKRLRTDFEDVAVIMISGYATVQNAVTATKNGAYDFIEKPISKEKLLISIQNALETRSLQRENLELRQQVAGKYEIIGQSAALQQVLEEIAKVAPTNGRVLISGESGTGKELIARAIHENSPRQKAPFIKVNCAAIPEELIESELFGAEKGAYTGATQNREGKFSLADGGTLFLDEVGDMSPKVQAKVLRALQEGEFEKVGGHKTEKVDVRVLAATNKDLEKEVRDGNFREDLLYRLNVVPIVSPAVRQRRDDIPVLVEHFVQSYSRENGTRPKKLSPEALEALRAYDWPGNIREIKNLVERLMIMCIDDEIGLDDLPNQIQMKRAGQPLRFDEGLSLRDVREQVEREYIEASLKKNDWNISQTAKALDVDRTNLHKKINYYGLSEKG